MNNIQEDNSEATTPVADAMGTHAFELQYYDSEDGSHGALGYFFSIEDAEKALVNWIIDEWGNIGCEPWLNEPNLINSEAILASEDPLEDYIKTYSVKHLIKHYFDNTTDNYSIDPIYIPNSVVAYATGVAD